MMHTSHLPWYHTADDVDSTEHLCDTLPEDVMDVDTTLTAPYPFHYYDWHETVEDLVGDSAIQTALMLYLAAVLHQLLRDKRTFVALNLNIYTAPQPKQYPIAPDIAVYQDVMVDLLTQQQLRSWCTYEPGRPPPTLVVEVASASTWQRDLDEKPQRYADLGVAEYILYDPNVPRLLPGSRLRLWRSNGAQLVLVGPDAQGRCWSTVLERYVTSDGAWLRLTDRNGARSLTVEEAERAAKEAERAAKEVERAAKEAAEYRATVERVAKEAAWAKLRELGIDPTTLEQ